MDPRVLEVQTWVNANYFTVPGYTLAPVTGRTGWSTMYSLTMALQHELGISPVIESFGPSTMAAYRAYGELTEGNVPDNQKGERIVQIIQGACWCKGYNPGGFDGIFGPGTKTAIANLQRDANLPVTDGKVYDYIFKALLSMDAYILTPGGDPKIQTMQRELNYSYFRTSGVQPTDGHYQRGTNKALIYGIQTEQGIPAAQQTGTVGPTTRDRLPLLSYGRTGVFVKFLQYALYVNNYDPGAFDGSFGLGVQNTVKEFQKFVGLTPDGYAGKQTWLSALISTGDPTRKGTACDCVTQVTPARAQTLINAGYQTVGRYLTNVPGSNLNKKIQPGEIDSILDSGLKIFPIYQLVGLSASYFDFSQGRLAAVEAYEAAIKFGFKEGTTIYFAVDFDAQDGEITSSIIPYFEGISAGLDSAGNFYKVGVYGARNVCIRVSEKGLADTSFVSGMSTGFSGNLGYPLPSNWAFDQISTISIGNSDGFITIDNNIKSGKYNGESSVDPYQQGLNAGFFRQLNQTYQAAIDFQLEDPSGANQTPSELVTNYYRKGVYSGSQWTILVGPYNKDFETYVENLHGARTFIKPIDPNTMEPVDIQHLMATLSALKYGALYVGLTLEDFAGWAGDLYTVAKDVFRTRDGERYTGTLLERTYQSAYEHIGTNTLDSNFELEDVLSDIDAVNIARKMSSDNTIVDVINEYYISGYRTRFNSFYNAKYGSNAQILRQAAIDVMVGTINETPQMAAGRWLLKNTFSVPDFTDEEGKAIANAYTEKILYYVRNEIDM